MNDDIHDKPLAGQVALVAGATRGAGRAIAIELGAAGATVYATGRSTRGNPSPMARAETIEETAELVDAAGGRGIAVRVDHGEPVEVAALVRRIGDEQEGRLDVLVNDVWGGDPLTQWRPFWEHDLDDGLQIQRAGVHTHLVTSWHAAPLMIARGRGLIVEITDGVDERYRGSLFYDLAKSAVIRLALAQAEDLRPHGVAAVAVSPGFLRSEAMLDHFGVTEATWRDAIATDRHFAASETPRFVARGIAALAADPDVMGKSGRAFGSWHLGREYAVVDVDGRRPDWGEHFDREVLPALLKARP
jgi:NAD(P)-dependent dehydrogenase (short-subunit alcohol dehydrogenase family)